MITHKKITRFALSNPPNQPIFPPLLLMLQKLCPIFMKIIFMQSRKIFWGKCYTAWSDYGRESMFCVPYFNNIQLNHEAYE